MIRMLVRRAPTDPPRQLRHRHYSVVGWIVNGNDSLHIELQALNVVEETQGERARRTQRRRRGRLRIVAIGLEQHLFLREIGDDHSVVVSKIPQVVELDDVRAVSQHFLVADRLDHWLLPGLLCFVRIQCVRQAHDFFEIGLVYLMGEDGQTVGDESTQAAGMIDVAMGVDQVPDRSAPTRWSRSGP